MLVHALKNILLISSLPNKKKKKLVKEAYEEVEEVEAYEINPTRSLDQQKLWVT